MSKVIFTEIGLKPPAPSAGQVSMYVKTDEVLYIQDSAGVEIPLGSATSITSLTGEATATGPGAAAVTLSNSAVIGKVLTGFTAGPNSTVLATDTLLQAFQKLQAQVSASSGAAITQLTSDVSATGPGSVPATVNSVGGSSASSIHSAELLANAATSINTSSAIVRRDASGNFTASTVTANVIGNVTGNVSGTSANVTGVVAVANGGTNSSSALSNNRIMQSSGVAIVEAAGITPARALISDVNGIPTQSVTTNAELAFVHGVTSNIQTQLNSVTGSTVTSLTGDVSATGPGAAVATVNSVGGSSAANIHSAELAANAATDSNTASTIVKRDASGNFSAGTITASLSGNATSANTAINFTGSLSGDVTGTQSATSISDTTVTSKVLTGYSVGSNTPLSATDSILQAFGKTQGQINATTGAAITALTGDVAATGPGSASSTIQANVVSNSKLAQMAANTLKGNNTGSTANAADLTVAQVVAMASAAPVTQLPDQSNAIGTSNFFSRADHIHNIPAATPVQIGTTNIKGSAASFALSDHVHALTAPITTGQLLTGYVTGTNTPITASNTILTAFQNLQAQVSASVGAAITALTGDVVATGPGSVPGTISVGAVTDTKASLSNKPAVTVVATTNQTLSGAPTIDGQATTAGTSIALLTAQTTASDNGPWIVQTGAWTRPTWFPNGGTTQAFQFITMLVRLGTVYQGSVWRLTTAGAITIGTTATTWTVTPTSGNFRSDYTLGLQTGAAAVTLAFANASKAIISWNPTSNFTLTMPPAVPTAGQYLGAADNAGTLQWTNPIVNIDGGAPNSNYVAAQIITGGTP